MEEKYKVHAFYILLILSGIIIGLVSVRWHEIPDLPGLITFALTITSLVLAVLAIVYAYVSNFSFQQTTAVLSRAAEDVVGSAKQVRSATDQLAAQVEGIPPLLSTVGERVERTHALMLEYSSREKSIPKLPESASTRTEDLVDRFVQGSSLMGLMGLLAMKHSFDTNKAVDHAVFLKTIARAGGDYPYGYVVATSAAGFIGYVREGSTIKCTEINSRLAHQLEGQSATLIAATTKSANRAAFSQRIKDIRALFYDDTASSGESDNVESSDT